MIFHISSREGVGSLADARLAHDIKATDTEATSRTGLKPLARAIGLRFNEELLIPDSWFANEWTQYFLAFAQPW